MSRVRNGTNGNGANGKAAPPDPGLPAAHLASSQRAAALTRLELALMRTHEALSSSACEIHKHVGGPPISWQDLAVLHSVRLRGGTPTLTEMLVFLHRHDLAALQYSFRKLETLGLVKKVRGPSRRERAYSLTDDGVELTNRHSLTRAEVTVALCADIVDIDRNLHLAASILERLIGMYDQSTATVLNGRVLRDPRLEHAAAPKRRPRNGDTPLHRTKVN